MSRWHLLGLALLGVLASTGCARHHQPTDAAHRVIKALLLVPERLEVPDVDQQNLLARGVQVLNDSPEDLRWIAAAQALLIAEEGRVPDLVLANLEEMIDPGNGRQSVTLSKGVVHYHWLWTELCGENYLAIIDRWSASGDPDLLGYTWEACDLGRFDLLPDRETCAEVVERSSIGPLLAFPLYHYLDERYGVTRDEKELLLALAAGDRHGRAVGQLRPDGSPWPDRAGEELEDGIYRREMWTNTGLKLWIYTPTPEPSGPLPLVVIAPAGSGLTTGLRLSEEDQPEHLPYVRAGYMVVAHDLHGSVASEKPGELESRLALSSWKADLAGYWSSVESLDAVQREYPEIDRDRIYAAGHSSAGTVALLFAAQEPRVSAVIAFAPVVDVVDFVGEDLIGDLESMFHGYRAFARDSSPMNQVDALAGKPTFLFHAADDDVVPVGETARFMTALGDRRHPSTRRVVVDEGGHYESMIDPGIGEAIEWLSQLPTPAADTALSPD